MHVHLKFSNHSFTLQTNQNMAGPWQLISKAYLRSPFWFRLLLPRFAPCLHCRWKNHGDTLSLSDQQRHTIIFFSANQINQISYKEASAICVYRKKSFHGKSNLPWGKKVKYQMAVTSEVNQMRGEIHWFNYDFIQKEKNNAREGGYTYYYIVTGIYQCPFWEG